MSDLAKLPDDALAESIRAEIVGARSGRKQWIESTLRLAERLAEVKRRHPDTTRFSVWLERHALQINKDDRAALLGLAKDLAAARTLLEQTDSYSWQIIWQKSPQRRLLSIQKSRLPLKRRRNPIPEVMRDDLPPPPERKAINLPALTREQVDPDFKGTSLEFRTKYGHVNLHTKEEIEHHKQQETLMSWLAAVSELDRAGRAVLAAAAVDKATLRSWMSKRAKAEKLREWRKNAQAACDRIAAVIGD